MASFPLDPELDAPPPRRIEHVWIADLYCGELGSIPSAGVMLNPTAPFFTVGSGNFGTPCDRMHAAYSSALPDAEAEADDGDVDAGAPATPGPLEPLEHPAANTAAPTSAKATGPACRIVGLRLIAEAIAGIPDI